ncbi:uncharacterized protein LOC114478030 isoform X2 [Gouania willdenowi]|uniref:uncharacterized protein LOC114478030 isoform X2 n=1 Tax=Gouania willdenowi TaxID=441366 RepID=UPI0010559851|nr:uncharacterized protein LOC114478030 isoform X2 [Gouania willdenowi]
MEDGAVNNTVPQPPNYKKKKQPKNSYIVFSKGNSIKTIPCLSEQLKGIPGTIIGLNYVWEYRSPSKSAPPHYQCKLCSIFCLQNEIIGHVKGWKHSLKYMEKRYPDKVCWEKEEATRDPEVRKAIKDAAAEVEQMEGKGRIKVLLKEPSKLPAFKGHGSTKLKKPPGINRMRPPFNPKFPGPFPRQGDPFSDRLDEYSQPGFGKFPSRSDFPDPRTNQRSFLGHMEGHSAMGGTDGYLSGQHEENHGNLYPDKYLGGQMDGPMNRPIDGPELGTCPQNLSSTLLSYLDSFQIENEDDAQLVLKVTQKLTDVLMEYRLRSVNKDSSLNNMSMSNSNFSQSPSRFPGGSNRYSGPSRFSDGPSSFYQ